MSVIVKHSPPYIKCVGPDSPLTVDRINIEFNALTKYDELHPGCVPKPYVLDDEHNLVIMQDLHDYKIMRKALVAGEFNMVAVKRIAEATAILHRKTHQKCVSEAQFADLVSRFQNDDMVSLTYDYVFTNPFLPYHPTNRCSDEVKTQLPRVHDDKILQENATKLRTKFTDMKQCLVHGDLHTGSIMLKQDLAKMMDLEFAYIGPAAFDVGMLLANYVFSCYSHKLYPTEASPDFYKNLVEATKATLTIYLKDLNDLLTQDEIASTVSDIAGFAGCELLRRIIGIAHVEDLEGRPLAEVKCVEIGIRLLQMCTEITNEQQLLDYMFKS
ncbi:methylthioribose kinase-like [Amphiura filiformis]|uniref:methylthioribose kinase-like n=1 Tax=Amphiura filiformis TaxID=82378 RepID=UPI003B215ECD